MAGFDMNYEEVTDYGIADGTYEVVINNAKRDVFEKSGDEYIQFDLIIRNDIADQKNKNSHIFYRIQPARQDSPKTKKGQYNKGMLLGVGKSAGIPDKTHFESLDDYFNKLYHLPLRVTVKNEKWENKKTGKSGENLNIKKTELSNFPNVAHKFKSDEINNAAQNAQAGMNDNSIDISDDDLPF